MFKGRRKETKKEEKITRELETLNFFFFVIFLKFQIIFRIFEYKSKKSSHKIKIKKKNRLIVLTMLSLGVTE